MPVVSADMMQVDFVARCLASRRRNASPETKTFAPVADLKYKLFAAKDTITANLEFAPLNSNFKCNLAYFMAGSGQAPVAAAGRYYYKLDSAPAIGCIVHGSGFTSCVLISDTENGAKISVGGYGDLNPPLSFEYLGKTWYISSSDYSQSGTYDDSNGIFPTYPNAITYAAHSIDETSAKAIIDYVQTEVIAS